MGESTQHARSLGSFGREIEMRRELALPSFVCLQLISGFRARSQQCRRLGSTKSRASLTDYISAGPRFMLWPSVLSSIVVGPSIALVWSNNTRTQKRLPNMFVVFEPYSRRGSAVIKLRSPRLFHRRLTIREAAITINKRRKRVAWAFGGHSWPRLPDNRGGGSGLAAPATSAGGRKRL